MSVESGCLCVSVVIVITRNRIAPILHSIDNTTTRHVISDMIFNKPGHLFRIGSAKIYLFWIGGGASNCFDTARQVAFGPRLRLP